MAGTFQAIIGEKFAPLLILWDDGIDMDSLITFTTCDMAGTDIASEIAGTSEKKP